MSTKDFADLVDSLLPCPFCDLEAIFHETATGIKVGCTGCKCEKGSCETVKGALMAWNRRAAPPPHSEDLLTPRDEFAMAALQGFLAGTSTQSQTLGEAYVAENAYSYADAMMKAREAKP